MSRYLVTGGAGFIGSNLCELLVTLGHEVFVLDDLSTGNRLNLAKLDVHLTDRGVGSFKMIAYPKLDGIFHLGMPSSIPPYTQDRQEVSKVVGEFITLLDYCKDTGCKLVYASTSNVYNGNNLPWHENLPIFPKDFYSEGRYFLERLARVYHEFYGVSSIGLRLFANYGPNEIFKRSWASVINQMLWAKNKGETFKIYGTGCQSRDYIFVKDTVRAFWLAMSKRLPEVSVLNVGTGTSTNFNQLASLIGCKTERVENPVKNYVRQTQADPSLSWTTIGFRAEWKLEDGIDWLKSHS